MSSSAKLERLLNLTAALLETPRPLTSAEIAHKVPGYPEEMKSFRRAFERDKDDLREMGIPITVSEVPGIDPPIDGYRIRKDEYYLRDPGLEPDELAALHLAASAVRLDGIEGAGALWKLGGVTGHGAETAGQLAALPGGSRVVTLFGAVAERRPVTFHYRDQQRTVDPYRLDFQRGRWYVTGYDHLRDAERNFRLDRIDGEITTGAPRSFERPSTEVPGARVDPWQLGETDPVLARVLVDAVQAPIAVGMVGGDAVVEERADGAVVVELAVSNPDGFRTFALSFLEHAEVLSPPELRADVVAWLRAVGELG